LATEVQAFSAVQLFMDRAAASGGSAELSEADAPIVAAICKKLDGIVLAIELAAGLVGAFGISGTAELLDSKFRLLRQQGRRTAPPRQRTLNALLDWSYNLLPECERRVLRRLGFFVGAFTLDAAQSVAAEEGARESEVIDAIHSLVAKSLISIATDEGQIFYRVLETTRAYGFEKLTDSGEMEIVGKRYGLHLQMRPAQTTLSLWSRRRVRASPCTHIARADGQV
jgi:predicted ATPase